MANNSKQEPSQENKLPAAGTGNASNPPLKDETQESKQKNQLIDERGEKYLREVASMEDYPDAQDDQDYDDKIREDKEN